MPGTRVALRENMLQRSIRNTDPDTITITQADIERALARPSSFGYSGDRDDMFTSWALGPVIETRDSDLIERSNAAALVKWLESDDACEGTWEVTRCAHWAVGWVDHLSYRVLGDDGTPTRIARLVKLWFAALAEYPIADEDRLSELQCEAEGKNWPDIASDLIRSVRALLRTRDALTDVLDDYLDDIRETNTLVEAARDYGESDGNGWITYSDREVEKIADVFVAGCHDVPTSS